MLSRRDARSVRNVLVEGLEERRFLCSDHAVAAGSPLVGESNARESINVEPIIPVAAAPDNVNLSWQQKASSPQRREESMSFTYGGKLYVMGGYIATPRYVAMKRVDVYNPSTNSWSRKRDMPSAVNHGAVAVDGRFAWIVGGFVGDFPSPRAFPGDGPHATRQTWKYDIVNDTYTRGPDLPWPRGSGNGAIVGRSFYFFGGANEDRTADRSDVYKLNLDNTSAGWVRIGAMPAMRNHFGAAAVNGRIYLIGGQFGLEEDGVNTDRVDIFNPSNNSWSRGASLPRAYSHFSSSTVVIGRHIAIVAGEQPHNFAVAWSYAYDTAQNTWRSLSNLPQPRRAGVAGLIGNKLYQTGGWAQHQGQTSTTYSADITSILQII